MRGSIGRLVLLLACVAVQPALAQSPDELFERATRDYENGRWAAAAEGFRSILERGIRDPVVHFNLANAEFRRGNLGLAVLHFQRAHRLDPLDEDIRSNLELAVSQCVDRVQRPESGRLVEGVRTLQDRVGHGIQAWIVLGLVWVVFAVIAGCTARPGGWRARYGWILAATLLMVALGTWSAHATYQRVEGRRLAVVLVDAIEVLAGPAASHAAVFTVHEGLTVEIREERGEWYRVSLPNGLNGWVARRAVGRV